jgi:hypothetical protein
VIKPPYGNISSPFGKTVYVDQSLSGYDFESF